MTARVRKKPLLPMPAHTCQFPGCGQEYPSIGDFADTDRAALLGGWVYRAGQWSCPGHRDLIPWWPGPARPVLPVRVPGVTRRAEVIGVPVAAIENVPRPGHGAQGDPGEPQALPSLPAHRVGDPSTARRTGNHGETAGSGHPDDDLEPLPPLPQRTPAGPPDSYAEHVKSCNRTGQRLSPAEMDSMAEVFSDPEPRPGGTIYRDITPAALAGAEPLGSLAPEPEEDEAQA